MTTGRTFTRWRRLAGLAQGALFLGLPFLRVKGESALRLDVPAGRLHAFGLALGIEEAFVVLAVVLLATFGFLLASLLLGRVWCGWSCPQTLLSDLTAWVVPERRARPRRWRRPLGFAAAALVSALFSAAFLWYFVPPAEFAARLATARLGPVLSGSWAALGGVLFADLALLRQTFCATVCPYAKLQGVLLDGASLVVAYDATRAADCVDCGACVRVCPTRIDIRDGLQMQCIACAACIDACQPVMRKLGRAPDLVGYSFGDPAAAPPAARRGRLRTLLRPGALGLLAATLAAAALLAALLARRGPLELHAFPDPHAAPRLAADGRAVDVFLVVLENRTREAVTVALSLGPARSPAGIDHAAGSLDVTPVEVPLAPGERRRVRAVLVASGLAPGRTPARLLGVVRAGGRLLGRQDVEVSLVIPEAR